MSRPFSYNDENFTVIGNMLFLHCRKKQISENEKIAEIPPAIYQRLTLFTIQGYIGRNTNDSHIDSYVASLYIVEDNNKHYIVSRYGSSGSFTIMAYMPLKDI